MKKRIGQIKLASAGLRTEADVSDFKVTTNDEGRLAVSFLVVFSDAIPISLEAENNIETFLMSDILSPLGVSISFESYIHDLLTFNACFHPSVNKWDIKDNYFYIELAKNISMTNGRFTGT